MGDGVQHQVRMYVLGSFKLEIEGRSVLPSEWKSKKALTLFKHLITHRGTMVRREILLDLLWPDEDPRKATRNLHTAIYAIRRMLEPDLGAYQESTYIRYNNGMYVFEVGTACWIDAIEFERLYREGVGLEKDDPPQALARFKEALSLYRGEYLTEEAYADWVVPIRDFFRQRFISMGRTVADTLAQDQKTLPEAVDVCQRILNEDPYREELHQAIIAYLVEAGRFAEAAVQFRQLENLLREEFNLAPSPETQQLLKKMQTGTDDVKKSSDVNHVGVNEPHMDANGPFVCDLKTFDSIRALALRSQSRDREPHTFMRINLRDPDASDQYLPAIFNRLQKTLRRGDVICFDRNQILIHLPRTDQTGSMSVKTRIEKMLAHEQLPEAQLEVRMVDPPH